MNNISKYIQLNDHVLLEYEFNRDGATTALSNPYVVDTCLGRKYFYEGDTALGITNNILEFNSVPTISSRGSWFFDDLTPQITYPPYWDNSTVISTTTYPLDTIKLHIISGYNFDDVGGFLLQVGAINSSNNLVDLANFTYTKQSNAASNVIKFSANSLFLGNKFYDKYAEFKIPSIQELGGDNVTNLGNTLNINPLSDVYLTYSTIFDIINNEYTLDENISAQLPVTSVADNFNCFIAESTEGDFIEYYATWNNTIIGDYIGDIEGGKIRLYTSNNPNDNYQDFVDTYGNGARKWVLIHEISVYEHIPGGTSLLTQKYSFTQDGNYSSPNYLRPILRNADIDSSYSIQYTCRLMNRMDGTQIIRKSSFSSLDPKKYGLRFTRLNVDNLIPYKVFNKIEAEMANTVSGSNIQKNTYIKVFYDTISVVLNANNEVYTQGTGPLFLKSSDSVYKFKFEQLDNAGNRNNVDLSGVYNFALVFKKDDNTKIEILPTYSTNMNTTLGELEFKILEDYVSVLLKQSNNAYSIIVKNPNGSSYTFYQGVFYSYTNQDAIIANYQSLYTVTDLQATIADLQSQVNTLTAENAQLKSK